MKLPILIVALAAFAVSCASAPRPAPSAAAPAKASKNLALGKTGTENNHILDFSVDKAFDGEPASYWEGAANSYPNEITVDLEKKVAVKAVTIKLNPRKIWTARTQTFSVLASDDGTTFRELAPSADYEFSPLDNTNAVTVAVSATTRYLRLSFTANTEATGGQVAEFEVTGE